MPNSLQTLDTSFPKIDDHQTTEENFLQVTNYLYMLLENLRYTLGNLGEDNFNETELESLSEIIREPIWARIEDAEGNIHTLNVTADNLSSQISDINGNVSSLTQTSQTLISRIQTAEGNISTLTQTAESLSAKITDAEGNISSLTQTVSGISTRVSDTEGNVSTLQQTANTLASRISDAEGNVSSVTQTVNGLSSRVESISGDVSSLTQTATSLTSRIESVEGGQSTITQLVDGISTRVGDAENNISSLTQTSQALLTRVSDVEGNYSSLTQTAEGLIASVSGVEGSVSTLSQTVKGMSLSVSNGASSSTISLVQDGVAISSKKIQITGMVTFSDLSTAGSTTINGSNVTTGTISASRIRLFSSMAVYTGSSGSTIGGYIGYTTSANDGSAGIHMQKGLGEVVATSNGAKITYNGTENQISASSGGVGITSQGVNQFYFGSTSFYTDTDSLLGAANNPWGQIYSSNSTISTSDRNKKHSIELMDDRYLRLFDLLTPYRFKFDNGTSDRYHPGFISQDVEEILELVGLDSKEFGGFVKDVDPDTGEDLYFLRYEEFIAILALKIKQQDKRIQALEEAA